MAQDITTSTKTSRRKRVPIAIPPVGIPPVGMKKQPPELPLHFSPDVEALLTPFRVKALQRIYEIAHRELGNHIKSTVVLAEVSYDEPGRISLVLAIWVDLERDEWRRSDRAISDAVFDEESSWTDDERDDYVDMIRFEILPLKA